METPSWVSYFIAWLATVALILLSLHLRRGRKLNSPPGPKPWPIIGNLNLIGSLPHRSIHALSLKYGPLMQLKFGSFPVVVASSAEMATAVLKTNDVIFTDRPQIAAGKYTTYNYSNITWAPYGPYWRQARKICMTELFSAKRLESYDYIRREEMKLFLKRLYESCGTPIVVKDHFSSLSLSVISRMVFGKKYTEGTGEAEIVSPKEFNEMLEELFFLNGVLDIGDSIPWLSFLDLQGNIKRMKALSKKFDMFLEHVLDEHNERRRGVQDYVAKDMLDVLLQLSEDPDLDVKLERHSVKAITMELTAGGTESSTVTLEWAISELLKKPEVLAKATEELDRVIGRDRWVEEQDIVNLPYIDSIVKETMRLHPVAPMLTPRVARQDCQLLGYDIPKGTRALVSVWAIGRDPSHWNNPDVFFPGRFMEQTVDIRGRDFKLLPFGAGRRMCPGYPLGIKVIQVSLANVLHGFTWELPGNTSGNDLNMEEIFGLSTPKKYPLQAVPEPRLPLHMYCR
ncbi:TRANSPARENT TESTA 7, CYTOCHROME P450 75B1 [Hibiscus trionum]|uniref:TRANSPARENT TESTA 7, CYTOCHROME P450 75B1 n=1 Tax=Hibiscus trionum TaxID=183268 RepID=A0A9W7LVW7_HIBTR|nr:TRANSPARENT TESTA 7, CYTOCHROME P450 75B1 [Hibiscus trionum]